MISSIILAGVLTVIGATTILFIRYIKDERMNDDIKDQQPLSVFSQVAWDNGKYSINI